MTSGLLAEHALPVPLTAFHKQNLHEVGRKAVCDQRWAHRREPDALVVGNVLPYVADAWILGDPFEGGDEAVKHVLRDTQAKLAFDVLESVSKAESCSWSQPVAGRSGLLCRDATRPQELVHLLDNGGAIEDLAKDGAGRN